MQRIGGRRRTNLARAARRSALAAIAPFTLAVVPASAGATAPVPSPVCASGMCTVTFSAVGEAQSWEVPSGVSSVKIVASGAGGGGDDAAGGLEAGGRGGAVTSTFGVVEESSLEVVVGGAGGLTNEQQSGSPGGFGGGGSGGDGSNYGGAGGGGGSFVFASGELLIAAGGGGGACGSFCTGGDGGQTGATGTANGPAEWAGQGATVSEPGEGGTGAEAGAGPTATPAIEGHGGDGETNLGEIGRAGGGGGGGYYGGGGGGSPEPVGAGGGGGGSDFVAAGGTSTSYEDGEGGAGGFGLTPAQDGSVTISYAEPAEEPEEPEEEKPEAEKPEPPEERETPKERAEARAEAESESGSAKSTPGGGSPTAVTATAPAPRGGRRSARLLNRAPQALINARSLRARVRCDDGPCRLSAIASVTLPDHPTMLLGADGKLIGNGELGVLSLRIPASLRHAVRFYLRRHPHYEPHVVLQLSLTDGEKVVGETRQVLPIWTYPHFR